MGKQETKIKIDSRVTNVDRIADSELINNKFKNYITDSAQSVAKKLIDLHFLSVKHPLKKFLHWTIYM